MAFCRLAPGRVLVAGTEKAGRRDAVVAQALALARKELATHWLVTEGDSVHGVLWAEGEWQGQLRGCTQDLLGLDKQYLANGTENDAGILFPQTRSMESLSDRETDSVSGAFHENQNDPVQKMESLIQSIVFLGRILYTAWARCGWQLVLVAWLEQVESLGQVSPGQVQHVPSGVWEHEMVLETE